LLQDKAAHTTYRYDTPSNIYLKNQVVLTNSIHKEGQLFSTQRGWC